MRPISDKETGVVDLDRLLEEYVEPDYLQHYTDSTAGRPSSDDPGQFFQLPASNETDLFGTSSSPILNQDSAEAWRKALQDSDQNPTSSMPNISNPLHIQSQGKASIRHSDSSASLDFFESDRNLDHLRSSSRHTPRANTPRTVKKAVSFNNPPSSSGIQKLPRKAASTSFPKMMQSSYFRTPMSDVWSRKLESAAHPMHFPAPPSNISSPPPSSRIVQHETGSGFFAQDHQSYGVNRSPLTSEDPHTPGVDFSHYSLTPQASPAIGVSTQSSESFQNTMSLPYTSSGSNAAISALHTPPSSIRLPMTTWGPEASPTLEVGYSAPPDFCASKTAGWWNESSHHANHFRESNQRSSNQNVGLTEPMGGLGISCDTTAFGDFGPVGLGVSVGESPMTAAPASSYDMASYSHMYASPPQQNVVNIGQRPLSRTPSPNPQPRFHRRRPSGQAHSQHHRTSHSSTASARRKSSNASQQSARQQATGGSGFVNFTPDDSRKILTGVAPSGSSKTKARREKEAADKRRKLSQAAMKAVMEAGGDIDSLRRLDHEGLLILES